MCYEIERICENCKHWRQSMQISFYGMCDAEAHDIDAPRFMVLLHASAHCINAAGGEHFEACEGLIQDAEEYDADPAAYYGVQAGVDFPATLSARTIL